MRGGWCGGVQRLWGCSFPFQALRLLDQVRPLVSVPCLVAGVCLGVRCCAVLCFAVLRRAAGRCAALRPSPPCRAVPRCAVLCLPVLWRVAPCCAVPCRIVLCCAVSRVAVPRCAALSCAVLRCAVLCCIVSCCALVCCAVVCGRSSHPLVWLGVALALVRLMDLLCWSRARVLWLGGGWWVWCAVVVSLGRSCRGSHCAIRSAGPVGCPWGCPPLGLAHWSGALWKALFLGVRGVPRVGMAWSPQPGWFLLCPLSLPPCRSLTLASRPCLLSPA